MTFKKTLYRMKIGAKYSKEKRTEKKEDNEEHRGKKKKKKFIAIHLKPRKTG